MFVCLIIIGGIGTVAAWIIGPTKGLLVAVRDGSLPKQLGAVNQRDVPVVILLMQAVLFTLLCSVFLLMPTVTSAYWLLTAITAQLAMLVYVGMFAAAIYLRYKYPKIPRAFKIPGGRWGIWCVGLLGLGSSVFAILLGFVPPEQVHVGALWRYESLLLGGIVLFALPPFVMYKLCRGRRPVTN